MTLVALERHALGPRLHVLGRRVLGLHRRPDGPPAPRARDRVPGLAAAATAAVGAINVASAMTADIPARARAVLALVPAGEVRLAHALALPAGLALLGLAWPLARRRRWALLLAVALLAALGVLNVVKSLDAEVAAASWVVAALLWRSRAAFWVQDDRRAAVRALLRSAADGLERYRAATLVRRHGSDTLSAFKLRRDVGRRFSPDGRAMAGYRIEAGAMLVAGDPVGPPDALPDLLDDIVAFAHRHGLALGAVGASAEFAAIGRRVGLRRLYLGDEAILPTGPMDLSGGAFKSLRKAVNRVARNGFTAELRTVGELDAPAVAELDALSARWRGGTAERGFSMAHDALVDELLHDATVVLARDADGHVRGFLHFVPVFGARAASLAFMRRDRDTPNGLNDFLVVEAARLLGEHGIDELSVNFVAFGRWLRAPANAFERAAARVLRRADRWFQIDRLLRFNAKFHPRWHPRYLLFAGPAQLPRVALGALRAEGQLPVPRLPRLRRGTSPAPVAA